MKLNLLILLLGLSALCVCVVSHAQTTEQPVFNQKESLAKARIVYKKLKQGENFEKIARTYSNDPGSARIGGNMGFAKPGQMIEPYEKTALSLKEGEISKPVKSEYGYHIIQLLEKNPDGYNSRHILINIP